MAVNAETVETYSNLRLIREDLQEAYSMISPEECPFQEAISTRTVTQPHFEWPVVDLAAPDMTNREYEGRADPPNDAATLAKKFENYTQISDKIVEVSHTSQATDAAAEDIHQLMKQKTLKMKEMKRDKEMMLLQNIAAAGGSSGNVRQTAGFQSWIATNFLSITDPTAAGKPGFSIGDVATNTHEGYPDTAAVEGAAQAAFQENDLNDIIEACWNAGAEPSIIMCNGGNKRQISAHFVGNSTRYKDAVDKQLVAAIDFYDSDFGELTVVPNRFLPTLNAATDNDSYSVLVMDPQYARVAYLDNVQSKPLAETGHAIRELIWCEYGLQVDNEAAHGIIADTNNAQAAP